MSKVYCIEFDPSELDQLVKILYQQTVITDDNAIRLIAKINSVVHAHSPFTADGHNFLSNQYLDVGLANVEEIYHRYRAEQLASLESRNTHEEPLESSPNLPNTLERISQSLEWVVEHFIQVDGEPLGFFSHYQQRVRYCETPEGSYWCFGDGAQTSPIAAKALTGRVKALNVLAGEAGDPKICLSIQADRFYGVEMPCNSLFCKTLLLALARLSPAQFRSPLTLEQVKLPNKQAVICQLYCQGVRIPHSPKSRTHWATLIKQVQATLAGLSANL